MSAIAGICHFTDEPINLEHGRRLMKELEKFPADDVQTWHSDKVFLGCHAQWITPESIGEKLPYYDHNRKLAITADAIIDNREELFEKLQVKKADQKTITDSELILLSYDKWGEECPKYLIGDFAFMICDEREQKMFGARDPSGYRTLYYYRDNFRFAICTTIEPLLSLPYIEKQLNENWLAEFLAISGMIDTVDARMTPYMSVEQIPPFHSITIIKERIQLKKYGAFTPKAQLKLKSSQEYIEAFQEIYQEAVKCRLRTHREIGSQLSGGLDSGSVVGFAAKALKGTDKILHTFSYIPPSDFVDYTPKYLMPDERPFIKTTVQHAGGILDNYYDFDGRNSYSEIDNYLDVMEMPYKFLENSFWLKGMFEKAHEKGVGVLLNGDRGNFTVSWGHALNYYALLLKSMKWFSLVNELNQFSRKVGGPRLRLLPEIAKIAFPFINQFQPKDAPNDADLLINPRFAERTGVYQKLNQYGIDKSGWFATSNIYDHRRILFQDIFPWNSGNTLDSKLSLRYKVWKRDPTNDVRVVRFCLSLPENIYVQKGLDRALIRKATENVLPDKIRLNQHIRGVQAADWVHRLIPDWNKIREEAKQLTKDQNILNFINPSVLSSILNKLEENPELTYTNSDYSLLMRCIVLYRFLKKIA